MRQRFGHDRRLDDLAGRRRDAEVGGDGLGEPGIDVGEVRHHARLDAGAHALAQLEAERLRDVQLLDV